MTQAQHNTIIAASVATARRQVWQRRAEKYGNGAPASVATPPREVWQRENRCGLNQFDVNVDVVVIASANGNVFKVRSGLFWGVFILVHV